MLRKSSTKTPCGPTRLPARLSRATALRATAGQASRRARALRPQCGAKSSRRASRSYPRVRRSSDTRSAPTGRRLARASSLRAAAWSATCRRRTDCRSASALRTVPGAQSWSTTALYVRLSTDMPAVPRAWVNTASVLTELGGGPDWLGVHRHLQCKVAMVSRVSRAPRCSTSTPTRRRCSGPPCPASPSTSSHTQRTAKASS